MKERLMVKTLQNFIDNNNDYSFAILIGMRKTGKTTIFEQLHNKYKNSVYIDASVDTVDFEDKMYKILKDKSITLILIDEFTYVKEYEVFGQALYNRTSKNLKIIITGSSSIHMRRLSRSKLGGGRSKTFKLPPLTFIEYLYFTNKICSYNDIDNIDNKTFVDYLKLDGLDINLKLHLDADYFDDIYNIYKISDDSSKMGSSIVDIQSEELDAVRSVFAYKLSELLNNQSLMNMQIGAKERSHLIGIVEDIPPIKEFDLIDCIITDKHKIFKDISFEKRIKTLMFLLESGMALIVLKTDLTTKTLTIEEVLKQLANATKLSDISHIINYICIQLSTPLYYISLGDEILKKLGYTIDVMDKGMLAGSLLEVYIIGALSYHSCKGLYHCKKLDDNINGEVDVYCAENNLLMELTVSDKQNSKINISNYFRDSKMLRVVSTKDKNSFDGKIHKINYTKLCCMLDTGHLFNLEETILISDT